MHGMISKWGVAALQRNEGKRAVTTQMDFWRSRP